MTAKKEYLILFLIIIAAVLYLFFNRADRLHYSLPEPAAIEPAEVAGIKVEKPGHDALVLEKDGTGEWRIRPAGHAAETEAVREMIEAAGNLALTTLISEAKDYQRYDLHPDKALTVSLLADDGSLLRRFKVGGLAPSHRHTFVMLSDDFRVYHARGRLRRIFDKSADALEEETSGSDPAD